MNFAIGLFIGAVIGWVAAIPKKTHLYRWGTAWQQVMKRWTNDTELEEAFLIEIKQLQKEKIPTH